jgi:AGZA family xanthine/uracil permease-like MFS transporter
MAYIIAVNVSCNSHCTYTLTYDSQANILSDTGGNCICRDPTDPLCLENSEYLLCKQGKHLTVEKWPVANSRLDLNRNLITATAAVAGFSSFLFGFMTNMPVCLAPGMGLNAYFIFIFLSLIGMRQWLVKVIPVSLKIAAACGIGLFLAEVGLSSTSGIGAIAGAKNTPLEIAGCPDQYKDVSGICLSHKMTSPTVSSHVSMEQAITNQPVQMWLGIMGGGILTAYLMTYKVKSAMILAILLVSIISWPYVPIESYTYHQSNMFIGEEPQ